MSKLKGKLLIGVTGGIGSGKSEVCYHLESKGYTVLFADLIAKELYSKDKKLAATLVKRFGKEILNFKGKINLSKLKEVIFKNKKNYNDINKIVHPVVIEYIEKQIKKCKDRVILIETAILFESGFDTYLDYVVVVYSNKKNRMKRIMMRDGAVRKDVEKVMQYQIDERQKLEKADFIINNNKSIEILNENTDVISNMFKLL